MAAIERRDPCFTVPCWISGESQIYITVISSCSQLSLQSIYQLRGLFHVLHFLSCTFYYWHAYEMVGLKSFIAASAASALFIGANAGALVKRNEEPAQPSCVNYTPFVYAGCFQDPSSPRALLYNSNLPTNEMTVEFVKPSLS